MKCRESKNQNSFNFNRHLRFNFIIFSIFWTSLVFPIKFWESWSWGLKAHVLTCDEIVCSCDILCTHYKLSQW